jgi:hypothetical protein
MNAYAVVPTVETLEYRCNGFVLEALTLWCEGEMVIEYVSFCISNLNKTLNFACFKVYLF